ncbi:MFS transporter [Prevotella sp. OH937_COT-195]|uniref:MFS transporter n=1 Tax=Prevotella sp. OH937_COT-195 TaxID=2491051 RepID=UPI000F649206|nr:MFS transporter [Prevotella sp. OH937_COT-195]RRD02782.1 MFS transporter [Prevotella sp. OH937_COT-195]
MITERLCNKGKRSTKRNPWMWVPMLYIAEGLPNVIVMSLAAVMYMQLGMSDSEIGLYTSWLGLPWVIKPFWSPFVDLYKTKRWWVLTMQMLLGSSLAGVAFTLNASFWFQGTMFFFFLMAFSSATHDIAADGYYMLELDDHDQAWYVGIRNTFYRLAVIFGKGLLVPIAGVLQLSFRDQKAFAWSLVFYGLAGIFIAFWLYHGFIMPRPAEDKPGKTSPREVLAGIMKMFVTFFNKFPPRQVVFAMLFFLLYRFPEAMLSKMTETFLLRPNSEGGLGLTPVDYGLANGTVGLIGLILGGIIGGMLAGRDGLKKWFWFMVCAITLPDIVYVWMSFAMPSSLFVISSCLFVEQFGYGLGFTALTLYMLYYCKGEFKTSHYAICTGITYLGLMLPGMVSGYIKDAVGYNKFFIIIMGLCLITFIVSAFVKIDPSFGKKIEG